MQARHYRLMVATSSLFAIMGFHSVKAQSGGTVKVTTPFLGQVFHALVTNNGPVPATVLGGSNHVVRYEPTGTEVNQLITITRLLTLTHGGRATKTLVDTAVFPARPGLPIVLTTPLSDIGDFPVGQYSTQASTIMTAGDNFGTIGKETVGWSVDLLSAVDPFPIGVDPNGNPYPIPPPPPVCQVSLRIAKKGEPKAIRKTSRPIRHTVARPTI